MKSAKVSLNTSEDSGENSISYNLRVLFFEHDECWSAQCLEYDIATQADTLEDLFYEVERILVSHIALADELGQEPFKELGRAPQKFWDMFEKSNLPLDWSNSGYSVKNRSTPKVHPIVRVARQAA